MRLPVWIIILFTFIGTFVFLWDLKVHAAEVLSCYGDDATCAFFSMYCPNDYRINVERLQYGLTVETGMSCQNGVLLNCTLQKNKCCAKGSNSCIVDFPELHAESVRNNCSDKPSCGPLRANRTTFNTPDECNGKVSDYVIVNYSCGPGTDTAVQLTSTMNGLLLSGNKSSSSGKPEDGISVAAIIGLVIAAIVVIALVAVALIIFKRRHKKSTKDDTHMSKIPKVLTNHMYEGSVEVGKNSEVVETANYDVISDESLLNYSLPEKDEKGTTTIPVTVDKCSDVSTDEYDKIEFKMKGAMKASNYDRLAAFKGKTGDDPYSHVSNGSKFVTIETSTVNDYSHCKPNSKDRLRNGDDYSHAVLERDCTIKPESDINEDDSYNHTGFGDTKHAM